MSKNFTALFLVAVFCCHVLSAQENPVLNEQTLNIPQVLPNTDVKPEKESDIRRAEIIFLISLPFTAILSFLITNGAYFISDPSYRFSLPGLPPAVLPFSIVAAVFTSGMISFNDYRITHRNDNEPGTQKELNNTHELQMGINFEKKF